MNIYFLGDSHGKIPNNLPDGENDLIISVGDVGFGFHKFQLPNNFHFIRGNHDDPEICRQQEKYLGDYGFLDLDGQFIVYISGAMSIDRHRRKEHEWFKDEELSHSEFEKVVELVEKTKPKIIVSHDCPQILYPEYPSTMTRNNLNFLFEHIHRPDLWIFGHHHYSAQTEILGTRFVQLGINELFKL